MINYAAQLPVDRNNQPMQGIPAPKLSLSRYASDNATASSVLTLTDNTTVIEIAATGGAAVMRWVATTDTQASVISAAGTANFDHVIPSGAFRRFVVPIERYGVSSVVGLNKQNGLYNRVAIKAVGVSSIATSEF